MESTKRAIQRSRPVFTEQDISDALQMIEEVVRSGHLTMGPLVESFEEKFARYVGVKHAIAVSSGTAALEIALNCLGVSGREVIVPTETFVASGNAVIRAGGQPVFAEISPATLCLDLDDSRRRLTPNTAGIMLVHMGGLVTPDLSEFKDLCDEKGLFLLEDAAHAHGASLDGKKAGSLGDIGCFSFYPTKIMTTGEGGMITTDDGAVAESARSLRNHGANPYGTDYVNVSTNWRLPETAAALGIVQLDRLDEFVGRRNEIARMYDQGIAELVGISALPEIPTLRHSYWIYLALLDEVIERKGIADALWEDFGVPTAWPYAPPCHLQPVFRDRPGTGPGELRASERILSRHIALPMHAGLSDEDVLHILGALKFVLGRSA